MTYSTTTIGAVLDGLNRTYFLPAIQRPFVWKQDQVLALFDSLLKGYPISAFMFWALDDDTKHQVRIYKFIENFQANQLMNEPAQVAGRDVVLVLDGQQRMTSLLIGLRGTSDRTITQARAAIRESLKLDRNFPTEKLFEALGRNGRLARLDERGIEEVLQLEYKSTKCFFALSLLYDHLDWAGTQYHVDHIIPHSHADRRRLMSANISEHRIKEIMASVDRIGNLQLLPAGENLEKSDMPFDTWMQTRDGHYLKRHFIPDIVDDRHVSKLPEFVSAREKLIWQNLKRLQIPA